MYMMIIYMSFSNTEAEMKGKTQKLRNHASSGLSDKTQLWKSFHSLLQLEVEWTLCTSFHRNQNLDLCWCMLVHNLDFCCHQETAPGSLSDMAPAWSRHLLRLLQPGQLAKFDILRSELQPHGAPSLTRICCFLRLVMCCQYCSRGFASAGQELLKKFATTCRLRHLRLWVKTCKMLGLAGLNMTVVWILPGSTLNIFSQNKLLNEQDSIIHCLQCKRTRSLYRQVDYDLCYL